LDTADKKNKIRQNCLEQRSQLEEEDYQSKSSRIIERLTKLSEFKEAGVVHCYVSLNRRKEVNTHPLIKMLLKSNKKVAVPVTNFKKGTLTNLYLDRFEELKENKWGVPEPQKGKKAEKSDIDLVVVPMVAGDLKKNRIGYGKGFYDRFLRDIGCPSAGLVFELSIADEIPVEDFDIPLSKLITEKRVID